MMPCDMIGMQWFQVIRSGSPMITKSFTLQLDGMVTLDRFAAAIDAWRSALTDISNEVGREHVPGIYIEELTSGSAPARPDQAWVADITSIRPPTTFAYLACVLDAWSRRCVGWQLSRAIDTTLTLAALDQALTRRRPPPRPSLAPPR